MHQYDPQHPFGQVRIKLKRFTNEVVQRRDRFHTGKTAAGDHKGEQRLPIAEETF